MKIFVKVFNVEKRLEIEVSSNSTVEMLKNKIQELTGNKPDQQRLRFAARFLEDYRTLADYNIQDNSTLHVLLAIQIVPKSEVETMDMSEGPHSIRKN